MDRQRTFFGFWMLAAVTVFSACGVSGDEPGDDIGGGGGGGRVDGGSGSTAPHPPGTDCNVDENTLYSCEGVVDPCAPRHQFCQADGKWSGCMLGMPTADCRRDAGVSEAGPSDGSTADGGMSDADTDADVEMDGGCMCPTLPEEPYQDGCGNWGVWWCPAERPCSLEVWIEATPDHQPCDAGVSDDGGTTTSDGDVPPVLDGDACVCPAPEICTTSCGIEGFRLCDRSTGCGLSRCLVLPGSTCPDGGAPSDAGPTDTGPMDAGSCTCANYGNPCLTACGAEGITYCGTAPTCVEQCLPFPGSTCADAGPTDAGVCTCPPIAFCAVACGVGLLTCDPTDCSTSCDPIPSTCSDAGPTDAGPTDAGPVDSGPADAGPMDAGVCACPAFGDLCFTACGAEGVTICSAFPTCTPQCLALPGSTCADAGPVDSGPADAGPTDSGPADSGPVDAGPADSGPVDAGSSSDAGPSGGSGTLTITASIAALDAAFGACTTGGWQVVIWDWSGIERESPPGVATLTITTPPLSGYRAVTVKCGSSYKAWPIASLTSPANSNGWITSILLDGVELADDEARVCHDVYSDPGGTDARFNRPMVPMASSIFRTCP